MVFAIQHPKKHIVYIYRRLGVFVVLCNCFLKKHIFSTIRKSKKNILMEKEALLVYLNIVFHRLQIILFSEQECVFTVYEFLYSLNFSVS